MRFGEVELLYKIDIMVLNVWVEMKIDRKPDSKIKEAIRSGD